MRCYTPPEPILFTAKCDRNVWSEQLCEEMWDDENEAGVIWGSRSFPRHFYSCSSEMLKDETVFSFCGLFTLVCINVCCGSRAHRSLIGLSLSLCAGLFIAPPKQWIEATLACMSRTHLMCVCLMLKCTLFFLANHHPGFSSLSFEINVNLWLTCVISWQLLFFCCSSSKRPCCCVSAHRVSVLALPFLTDVIEHQGGEDLIWTASGVISPPTHYLNSFPCGSPKWQTPADVRETAPRGVCCSFPPTSSSEGVWGFISTLFWRLPLIVSDNSFSLLFKEEKIFSAPVNRESSECFRDICNEEQFQCTYN